MKKNYKAPTFDVITYSLQEAIAANCDVKKYPTFTNGDDNCMDPRFTGFDFGTGESCNAPIDGYCYFTSTSNIVSTS